MNKARLIEIIKEVITEELEQLSKQEEQKPVVANEE